MTIRRMNLASAVRLVHDTRHDDDVVVSSMGNAREWMALGPLHERDLVLVPSAMGHATSMGLGIALAQPQRRVIVMSGDGSLLMNLGSLVTIAAQAPRNLVVILFDNGVYEVTGSQPTPGTPDARVHGDAVDFIAIARASGFRSLYRWSEFADWKSGIDWALADHGPTFIALDVAPDPGKPGPKSPGPAGERAKRLMLALNG
jgi:thiamine pyrophosphate-dependent acetolactate synthase large subunit-like protein